MSNEWKVNNAVEEIMLEYDKLERLNRSGSIVSMELILNRKPNGDLVIMRSINEMRSVTTDNTFVSRVVKALSDECVRRKINFIDGRKVTNN